MLTQKNLKLHNKAINLLEMIERCDEYITNCRNSLYRQKEATYYAYVKGYYEKQIIKYKAIRTRLIAYYAEVMKRLVEPALSNAIQLGTIVINNEGKAEPAY